jgi:hypothetical protein
LSTQQDAQVGSVCKRCKEKETRQRVPSPPDKAAPASTRSSAWRGADRRLTAITNSGGFPLIPARHFKRRYIRAVANAHGAWPFLGVASRKSMSCAVLPSRADAIGTLPSYSLSVADIWSDRRPAPVRIIDCVRELESEAVLIKDPLTADRSRMPVAMLCKGEPSHSATLTVDRPETNEAGFIACPL